MIKEIITLLIFLKLISNCFAQQKGNLRFDGVYYWDNKKDTIIKDYNPYRESTFEPPDMKKAIEETMDSDFYVPAAGSRLIYTIRFYPNDTLVMISSNHKFDIDRENKKLEEIKENYRGEKFDDVHKYSFLKENEIYFEREWSSGNFKIPDNKGNVMNILIKELKKNYTGTIMPDSIVFKITDIFPPAAERYKYGEDSIMTFHFVKFQKNTLSNTVNEKISDKERLECEEQLRKLVKMEKDSLNSPPSKSHF